MSSDTNSRRRIASEFLCEDENTEKAGTTVLCSSPSREVSLTLENGTLFTNEFSNAIKNGFSCSEANYISLLEIKNKIIEEISRKNIESAAYPEIHSPEQRHSDIANLRIFPNLAKLKIPEQEEVPETKKSIGPNQELDIRREYSKLAPSLEAAKLLLDNLFHEMCYNFNGIYYHESRIKPIERILNKIAEEYEKGSFQNTTSILTSPDIFCDLIGCRLIVYAPTKILEIHDILQNYDQFKITRVTIHSSGVRYDNIRSEVISSVDSEILNDKVNKNSGYFSVHYSISYKPIHYVYKLSKSRPYEKFELQVRTLLQHTWCEFEDKFFTKHNDKLLSRFPQLKSIANDLSKIDLELDNFFRPNNFTPDNKPDKFIKGNYREQYYSLAEGIFEFRKKILPTASYAEVQSLIFTNILGVTKYSELISNFKSNLVFQDRQLVFDLGLLYSEGRFFEDAITLFESFCRVDDERDIDSFWLRLRLAEVYYAKAGSELNSQERVRAMECLKTIVNKVKKFNKDKKFTELCNGTAILCWKLRKPQEAKGLTNIILNFSVYPNKDPKYTKYLLNHAYFCLDLILPKDTNNIDLIEGNRDEINNLIEMVDSQLNLFDSWADAIDDSSTKDEDKESRMLDTLAWLYRANSLAYKSEGKIEEARNSCIKALEYITECIERAIEKNSVVDELWLHHKKLIEELNGKYTLLESKKNNKK